MIQKKVSLKGGLKKAGFLSRLANDIKKHPCIYILALPVILYFIAFKYIPMFGLTIAFKNYVPAKGVFESSWAGMHGFEHFVNYVKDPYFFRTIKNTLMISLCDIIFGFPMPIIFALLLNEVRHEKFKKVVQTITYLPHFISIMVVCGMITAFVGRDGVINDIIAMFGGERSNLLANPAMFRPIYIISGIWQGVGWGSIMYLAALSGIDSQLYEAASVDGAGVLRKIWHVSLPGIIPTIVIMLILKLGTILSVGYEKIILLYSPITYETSDVISTYVYRRGIINSDYSFSAAVGLMNSLVNLFVVIISNKVSRHLTETSLW